MKRLVPSVESLLQLPSEANKDVQAAASRFLATAALAKGSVGLSAAKHHHGEGGPQGTRSVRVRCGPRATAAILRACSEHDIELDAAVQACCGAATYSGAAQEAQERPYTSTMRFSLRQHMPAPYNGPALAAGLCTAGFFEQTQASQTWMEKAKQYTKRYRHGLNWQLLQSRREYAKQVLNVLQQDPPPPPPISSEIDISSVGNADLLVSTDFGPDDSSTCVRVSDISLGVETLSRQVYCFVWTFDGKLVLNLVYNEGFYTAATASNLVHKIRAVLVEQLKVDGEIEA